MNWNEQTHKFAGILVSIAFLSLGSGCKPFGDTGGSLIITGSPSVPLRIKGISSNSGLADKTFDSGDGSDGIQDDTTFAEFHGTNFTHAGGTHSVYKVVEPAESALLGKIVTGGYAFDIDNTTGGDCNRGATLGRAYESFGYVIRLDKDGKLDTRFGTGGKVSMCQAMIDAGVRGVTSNWCNCNHTDFRGTGVQQVQVLSDGSVIGAGFSVDPEAPGTGPQGYDMKQWIFKLDKTGKLDPTFGTNNGNIFVDVWCKENRGDQCKGLGGTYPTTVFLESHKKILRVPGETSSDSIYLHTQTDWAGATEAEKYEAIVIKLDSTGHLDKKFASNGIFMERPPGAGPGGLARYDASYIGFNIDSTGRPVIGSNDKLSKAHTKGWYITRIKADGSTFDDSFNGNKGYWNFLMGSSSAGINDIEFQNIDGEEKIVATGKAYCSGAPSMNLLGAVRLMADGTGDGTFDGTTGYKFGCSTNSYPHVDSDGMTIFWDATVKTGVNEATNGYIALRGDDLTIQVDNKIVIVGQAIKNGEREYWAIAARLNGSGAPGVAGSIDTTFNAANATAGGPYAGYFTIHPAVATYNSWASWVDITPENMILMLGTSTTATIETIWMTQLWP